MTASRSPELEAAYAECSAIAKREAKNFYYGFLALPKHKREAMCAVYAFMRRADDISDDESYSLDQRREMMAAWLNSWQAFNGRFAGAVLTQDRDRAVFLAVRDVQLRFRVSDTLLDQLIAGTTMDLEPEPPAGVRRMHLGARTVDQYETLEALERYCYLVASVVGLTTIRIFGYTESAADRYAEQVGLAFQLTNILRDVKEDAERGRIYLPQDRLAAHSLQSHDVMRAAADSKLTPDLRALLTEIADRAERYYGAAAHLIPLLDSDSQPAMRVLVDIYHLLLKKIVAHNYDVLSERISVSNGRKCLVLARGMVQAFFARGRNA